MAAPTRRRVSDGLAAWLSPTVQRRAASSNPLLGLGEASLSLRSRVLLSAVGLSPLRRSFGIAWSIARPTKRPLGSCFRVRRAGSPPYVASLCLGMNSQPERTTPRCGMPRPFFPSVALWFALVLVPAVDLTYNPQLGPAGPNSLVAAAGDLSLASLVLLHGPVALST